MHPLAHALAGGLVGQVAASPGVALLGGLASHLLLDRIPHTEGDTFRNAPATALGIEHLEAVVELSVAIMALWWAATRCPGVDPLPLVLGALGGLLPDMVDVPLHLLFGRTILHREAWHRTAARRRAAFGIVTQILTILGAGFGLWLAAGCGR